jgi:hypothetical protein
MTIHVGLEMSRIRLLSSPRSFLFSAESDRRTSGIRLGFKPLSGSNSESDCLGEAYFFMDVTDIHERRIMITFYNRAPVPCAISDIYLVDGETLSISVQSVRDQVTAKGPACAIDIGIMGLQSLPGLYHASRTGVNANHLQDDSGAMQYGIKQNESLGIVFDLQAGVTLADILTALNKGILNISLKLLGVTQGAAGILINDSRLGISPG